MFVSMLDGSGGGHRVRAAIGEHMQDGEETHHQRQTFVACDWGEKIPDQFHLFSQWEGRGGLTRPLDVAPRHAGLENRAESACLTGLMLQSARNTPSPPSPARSGDDITSPRSSVAGNSCRPVCGRWKFFPTAATLLRAVTPATRCIVSKIRDFECWYSRRMDPTMKKNPVIMRVKTCLFTSHDAGSLCVTAEFVKLKQND